MQPSEVRRRVLRDHDQLRRQIEDVSRLASDVITRDVDVGGLRAAAAALLASLAEHMKWEDRYLAPALENADAWGPERVALLSEDHRNQREFLSELVDRLHDTASRPLELAAGLLEWIDSLHRDMEEEEAAFLDPDILRDDIVGIDVETG